MALLFLLFFISMLCIAAGWRRAALALALFNVLLCLAVFWHHLTTSLDIRL